MSMGDHAILLIEFEHKPAVEALFGASTPI